MSGRGVRHTLKSTCPNTVVFSFYSLLLRVISPVFLALFFSWSVPAYAEDASAEMFFLLGEIQADLQTRDLQIENLPDCAAEELRNLNFGIKSTEGEGRASGGLFDPLIQSFRLLSTAAGFGLFIDVADVGVAAYNSFSTVDFSSFKDQLTAMASSKLLKMTARTGKVQLAEGKVITKNKNGDLILQNEALSDTAKDVLLSSGGADIPEDIIIEKVLNVSEVALRDWWLKEKKKHTGKETHSYTYSSGTGSDKDKCTTTLNYLWDKSSGAMAITSNTRCQCPAKLEHGHSTLGVRIKSVRDGKGIKLKPTITELTVKAKCCDSDELIEQPLIDETWADGGTGATTTTGEFDDEEEDDDQQDDEQQQPTLELTEDEKRQLEAGKRERVCKADHQKYLDKLTEDWKKKRAELEQAYDNQLEDLEKKRKTQDQAYKQAVSEYARVKVLVDSLKDPTLSICDQLFDKQTRISSDIRFQNERLINAERRKGNCKSNCGYLDTDIAGIQNEIKKLKEERSDLEALEKKCKQGNKKLEQSLPGLKVKRDIETKKLHALEDHIEHKKNARIEALADLDRQYEQAKAVLTSALKDCNKTGKFGPDVQGLVTTPPAKDIQVSCSGSACLTPVTGSCSGTSCPDLFTLNCSGNSCPIIIRLDCIGTTCTSETNYTCLQFPCPSTVDFICTTDSGCTQNKSGTSISSLFSDGFESGDTTSWLGTRATGTGAATGTGTTGKIGTTPSATPSSIDTSNLHPDSNAIPITNFDLQQLKSYADAIKAAAENCGKDLECPIIDCNKAKQFLQVLYEAKRHMTRMKEWSKQASDAMLRHRNSLVEQSIITSTNTGNAVWAQGVHQFLHNLGSLLLDIASLVNTFEDLAKDGLDPSKVKNLDKLYETLKTYESAIDTLADQKANTKGTGPINDFLTSDADKMLGLENTSTGSIKSDISDTLSAIDNYRNGKPWKVGRDVGQIVGRVLKDISKGEMNRRAARIAHLGQSLMAEEGATSTAHNSYSRAVTRRNLVEDASAALDAAYSALHACIVKHCRSAGTLTSPTVPSFSGWGQALRYYNALIPRINTALASFSAGISFKEREDCGDPPPSTSISDDPFAAVKELPIDPGFQTGGAPSTGTTGGFESVLDDLSEPLRKISTKCTPCQSFAREYNQTIDRIKELQTQLEAAIDEQDRLQREFDRWAGIFAAYNFPYEEEYDRGDGTKGKRYRVNKPDGSTSWFYDEIGQGRYNTYNDYSDMQARKERARQRRDEAQAKLVEAATRVRTLRSQRDAAYETLNGIKINLVRCESQCNTVRIINVIGLTGNNPFDRQDPLDDSDTTAPTAPTAPTTPTTPTTPTVVLTNASFNALCDVNHIAGGTHVLSANGFAFCSQTGFGVSGGTANLTCVPGSTVTISSTCTAIECRAFANTITNLSCASASDGSFFGGAYGGAGGFTGAASINCTCQ